MPTRSTNRRTSVRKKRVAEATQVLTALGFSSKQRNDTAAYTLLALLDLRPESAWSDAQAPLRGVKSIIDFIAAEYGKLYVPNTRETIRDDAVKYFVAEGMLLRNPDDPLRSTNSGKTVYQVEPSALRLFQSYGHEKWSRLLTRYLHSRKDIKHELVRRRQLARVPVTLPDGSEVSLSPGGQNPLIKAIIEDFCSIFTPGGVVIYIGDTEVKFSHLESDIFSNLDIHLAGPIKIPDVIVYFPAKNWLLLIEAVTSAGPVDGKRRKELKELFANSKAGLVFVTAFESRRSFQSFASQIAWESEVWLADDPNHMIHFNGDRFLGPYPDVV